MAPDGIKLPSDSTVASQKVHRSTSTSIEPPPVSGKEKRPPSPLPTIVLQSKPIIEGRKGELYQLLLQNDPKSEPPIKLYSDTNIRPGTPLLLELDENGQYRPIEIPTQAQLEKLIKLELDFWQAQLYPKAATKTAPDLPSTEALVQLAKNYPQLKPLIQWLIQRPAQINSQVIQQWFQENSPLTSMRSFPVAVNKSGLVIALNPFSANPPAQNQLPSQQGTVTLSVPEQLQRAALQPMLSTPSTPSKAGPIVLTNNPLVALKPALNNDVHQTPQKNNMVAATTTEAAKQSARVATAFAGNANVQSMGLSLLKFAFTIPPIERVGIVPNQPTAQTNESATIKNLLLTRTSLNESLQTAVIRTKQTAPMLGRLPPISTKEIATLVSELATNIRLNAANTAAAAGPQQGNKAPLLLEPNKNSFSRLDSPLNMNSETSKPLMQFASELLQITPSKQERVQMAAATVENNRNTLLEVKLGQWINLIDQTILKGLPDISSQLKAKALNILNSGAMTGDKIQTEIKASLNTSQTDKDAPLHQLRNWMDAAQAKMLHQAVQAASTQWQAPDLPVIQQMQLPLIWLGLTTWADIEWWQEKKKKKQTDDAEEVQKRRWRMRIFLTIKPMSEFCADIDWHPNDTHLVFWSEDSSTLAHLNTLVPTLKSWTQGLSSESIIQTRHGMPKRASEQQLKRSNHHLVDIKT